MLAQTTVSGLVLDKNKTPIEFATVYIDGSSKGAITDKNGKFMLDNLTFPCLLVVSHLSYRLKTVELGKGSTTPLVVALEERAKEIGEVSVSGISMRAENEKKFKKYFLYGDENASQVKFHNLDVLYFSKDIDTTTTATTNLHQIAEKLGRHYERTGDGQTVIVYRDKFSAKTTSPLILTIKNLGYKVAMDIEYFYVTSPRTTAEKADGEWRFYSCHSYSLPIEPSSEKEKEKFESNRRKSYFNSIRHFFYSLATNSLKENGFLIPEFTPPRMPKYKRYYTSTGKARDAFVGWKDIEYGKEFMDLSKYMVRKSDTEIDIVGLKGKTFKILYFSKRHNEPVDLNNYETFQWKYFNEQNTTYITFMEDTCHIYSNGSHDDEAILFAGKMSLKPIGTNILPDDYLPEKKHIK